MRSGRLSGLRPKRITDAQYKRPQQQQKPPAENVNKELGMGDEKHPLWDNQRKKFHAVGKKAYGDEWDDKRKEFCKHFGVETSNDLTYDQMGKVIPGMQKIVNERAAKQAALIEQPEPAGAY